MDIEEGLFLSTPGPQFIKVERRGEEVAITLPPGLTITLSAYEAYRVGRNILKAWCEIVKSRKPLPLHPVSCHDSEE
jgi:hypothetical protein